MRANLTTVPLRTLCTDYKSAIVDGPFGSNLKREHYTTVGEPVLKIQNVKEFSLNTKSLDYVTPEKARELSRHSFRNGDIVMTKLGDPLGVSAIVESFCSGIIVADLVRIRADKVDTNFLCYQLNSPRVREAINAQQQGATRPRVQISMVRDLPIWAPVRSEQRRIAAVLDEAFGAIATATVNAEKNLANARALFDATVRETFACPDPSWELMTLKAASIDFGRGKSKHRPRNDPKLYGGEYPFIQTGDVRNCEHLITEYSQTYNAAGLAQSKLWPIGTICITIAANIAETGILNFAACFPDSVIGMVVDPDLTSNSYVEYLLQSLKSVLQAKGKGSAQANINLATFENERFPFPPKDVQMAIVARLRALSEQAQAMEAFYADKLQALSELRRSLLHRAFAGELTPLGRDVIAA